MLAHNKPQPTAPFSRLNPEPIEKIAIIVAMPSEAAPLIRALALESVELGFAAKLGMKTYRGLVQQREIHLIVNGTDPHFGVAQVGTDSAALCCYETIRLLEPDTIISAGTAGGYAAKGARVGDVYLASSQFVFHDRRIPLAEYEQYGKGGYPCLEAPAVASALRLKMGVISTGNSLTACSKDQEHINHNGAALKDMEAAAIANVARRFNTRVMAIKVITNLADQAGSDAPQEFERNFAAATQQLANKLPGVLNYIIGKTPEQLQTSPLDVIRPLFARDFCMTSAAPAASSRDAIQAKL